MIRLIGTVYFKKNLATVVSRLGCETPVQLYNSVLEQDREEKHRQWYKQIRGVLPILSEEQRPPTFKSLWRHWQRSCWIKHMWKNSSQPDQHEGLSPPEKQGWLKECNEWKIDWEAEAEEVRQEIQQTVTF